MYVPEGRNEGTGIGCAAPACWELLNFSPRLEIGENAKSGSYFSFRIKWLPLSTSPFKTRWKPKEKTFDVVQLRNPSGDGEPRNAILKGYPWLFIGGCTAWILLLDGRCSPT